MLHDIKGCTGEEHSAILTNYPRAVKCRKLTYLRADWASLDVYTMFDGSTYPRFKIGHFCQLNFFLEIIMQSVLPSARLVTSK